MLTVWTAGTPADVCRQMAIPATFSQWQAARWKNAPGLESRVNLASGQALSPRLQELMQKRQPAALARLTNRLDQIRQTEVKNAPPPASKTHRPVSSKEPLKEPTS